MKQAVKSSSMNISIEFPKTLTEDQGLRVYEIQRLQGINGSPEQYGKYTVIKVWIRCIYKKFEKIGKLSDREKVESLAINKNNGDMFLLLPTTIGRGHPYVRWTEKRITAFRNGIYKDHELMEIFGKDLPHCDL